MSVISRPFRVTRGNESRSLLRSFIAILAATVLAGVIPLLLIFATPNPPNSAWWGALVVVIVIGCLYAWLVASGQPRLVEMSIWLFTYVFLGLAPLVQLRTGIEPSTTPGLASSLNVRSLAIVLVGCSAISIGGVAHRLRGQVSSQVEQSSLNYRRTTLLGLVALIMTIYFVSRVGLGHFFGSRDDLARAGAVVWPVSTTLAIAQSLATMPLLVAFVGLVKLRGQSAAPARSRPFALLAAVALALLITVNAISSPRYVVGTALLAAAASLGLYGSAKRFRTVAILAVAMFVLVFPLADAYRHSGMSGATSDVSPVKTLAGGDYDSFAQINNTVRYVDKYGVTDGRQALGVVFFWVPRSVWANKPVDTGILLAESRGYRFTNLSAPLWAELYINGGWPLLVMGMGVLGWFVRQWDDRICASLSQSRSPGVLACILPFYLILILRGSLLESMAYLSVILLSAGSIRGTVRTPGLSS